MWRFASQGIAIFLALSTLAACGDDPVVGVGVEPDPLLEALVGTWEADSLVVTSSGDSTIVVDVLEAGGTLTLNIQRSGGYTLTLAYAGTPLVDIGQLDVFETVIVSRSSTGSDPEPLSYLFLGDDRVRLQGEIAFPFTSGTPTPGEIYTELNRR